MIMSKIVASLAICLQLMNVSAYADNYDNYYEYGNLYPSVSVVCALDTENDIVTVQDTNGNLWQFLGCEDWELGDVVGMIMADSGTAEVWDDVIMQYRYCGRAN